MSKTKTKKRLVLSLKLVVAAGLLGLVFSHVRWSDYVQSSDGKIFTVLETREDGGRRLLVQEGLLWWSSSHWRPVADFEPLGPDRPDEVVRPGFGQVLKRIQLGLLILGGSGFGLSFVVIGLRWWILMRIQKLPVTCWQAIKLTFLGTFFNVVVPGSVGGDVVKAWHVGRQTHRPAGALLSIFLDRVLGLAEMAMLSAVMVTIVVWAGLEQFENVRLPATLAGVALGSVLVALLVMFSPRLRRLLHLQKLYGRLSIAHHFRAAGDAMVCYRRNLPALALCMGLTMVAHAFFIGGIVTLGFAAGLAARWFEYFVYVPLIYIIGAVPITPGGVGLIEGAYQTFFTGGSTASEVLALALLARIFPILWGLPGILVAVRMPRLPSAEQIESELEQDG